MEAVTIIPCLDMLEGRVVKGVKFVELKDAGDPVEAALAYERDGADELAFLDITATVEHRKTMFDVLSRVTAAVKLPVTVGGGIKSRDDVESAFKAGASAVSISSAALRDRNFVRETVREYGSGRVVVAIDVDVSAKMPSHREVFIDGGRTSTGVDAVDFAVQMRDAGAGKILPTSKATDGVLTGYDLDVTRAIADATGLPVIASGGAGKLEHFLAAVEKGKASALLAASVFHFGTFKVRQVKEYLASKGIPVRLGAAGSSHA